MPMDGLTLSFVRDELATTLIGGRVDKITQPERDEIIIALRSLGKNRALLISINPNCARIHLTGDKRVSPLEPSNFCMLMRKHLQGGKLTDVRPVSYTHLSECRSQSPVPYRLATPLYSVLPALQPPLTVKLIIE